MIGEEKIGLHACVQQQHAVSTLSKLKLQTIVLEAILTLSCLDTGIKVSDKVTGYPWFCHDGTESNDISAT